LRGWLEASSYPRLHASLIVFVSGASAFVATLTLLAGGVDSMPLRYGVAGAAGYLVFLLMIRAWIAWQRNRSAWDGDLPIDGGLIDVPRLPRPSAPSGEGLWAGGQSGGGGATGDWHVAGIAPRSGGAARSLPARASGGGWSIDLDLDDLIWIVIALAAACAGIVAIGYVIYAAPLLLAEVALDAALVSAAYRKLRREDAGHWAGAAVRRTWIPATVLIVSLVAAGYALQRVVPEARSIGGVLRVLTSSG
jgi:hypothetical protein